MSGSEGGEIPDRGAEGNFPTTGARCGAVQQNLGAKGEGEDEKFSPSEIFLQQLKISSQKSKFLPDWAAIGQKHDETRGPLVVTCSKERGGQGEASKKAVFIGSTGALSGNVENDAKIIETDLLTADVVSCSEDVRKGSRDDLQKNWGDKKSIVFEESLVTAGAEEHFDANMTAGELPNRGGSLVSSCVTTGDLGKLMVREAVAEPSHRGAEGISVSSRLDSLEADVRTLTFDMQEHLENFERAVNAQNEKDANMVMGVQLLAEGLGKQIGKEARRDATGRDFAARLDTENRARHRLEDAVFALAEVVQQQTFDTRVGASGGPMGPGVRESNTQGSGGRGQTPRVVCSVCSGLFHKSWECPSRGRFPSGFRGWGSKKGGANSGN